MAGHPIPTGAPVTTTHFIGDDCPGGHRDPVELVDHLNRELAAVDIAAVAKRLSSAQRRLLAEAAANNVYLTYHGNKFYQYGWFPAVTTTARSLIRADLVRQPEPGETVMLTATGRAVLDHLGERAS